MIDFAQAKVQLIEEYTAVKYRNDKEILAFHSGINYLIDYICDTERRLNDYIPKEVIYNKRTCQNVIEQMQQEFDSRLSEEEELHQSKYRAWQQMYDNYKMEMEQKLSQKATIEQENEKLQKKNAVLEERIQNTEQRMRTQLTELKTKYKKKFMDLQQRIVQHDLTSESTDIESAIILSNQRKNLLLKERGKRIDELAKKLEAVLLCTPEEKMKLKKESYYQKLHAELNGLNNKYAELKKQYEELLSDNGKICSVAKPIHKIVIAMDSFKGCLSSSEVEDAAMSGIRSILPECEICCIPISDGGEGIVEILSGVATNKETVHIKAHGPLMEMRDTNYVISRENQMALIEMAAINGLPLVPEDKRNPLLTTTYGTGELILDALDKGCRYFIIGLGGSATNDAGMGMLQALGFRFFNESEEEIGINEKGEPTGISGNMLAEITRIDTSSAHQALKDSYFFAACDVKNPFCGTNGAPMVFGSQKGANTSEIILLDNGMKHIAQLIQQHTGKDISNYPGSGAAGGMGGGLLAFLNAELKPGIELLLDILHFAEKIKDADLVITGEGKADRQTIMGKVPSGILAEADKQQIPVVLLAGSIENEEELNKAGFRGIFSITPSPIPLEQAIEPSFAKRNIKRTVEQICRIIQHYQ